MSSVRFAPTVVNENQLATVSRHPLGWLGGALLWLTIGLVLSTGLSACHDNDGSDAPSTAVLVGPAGGTVTGPDGVQVVIPAGALSQPTTIRITRSSAGAPTTLPEDSPVGPIYEFQPHGLVFSKPVTIRMPAPGNAAESTIFMASPDEDWQETGVTVANGFAEWQRNSFSWGASPNTCQPVNRAPYSTGSPDPYPCAYPRGSASASATPTTAITAIPNLLPTYFSPVADNPISWVVNEATTVQLTLRYAAAPDCQNPRVKLIRWDPAAPLSTPNRVTTLFDQPVVLTPTTYSVVPGSPGFGTYVRGVGSTTQAITFSHLDQGAQAFGYSFSCNRPFREVRTGGEVLTFIAAIPAPSATYTIGGAVSGLTGTGLVLQNNGGNNLGVSGDGSFTFSTAVAAGAPYAVSVQAQPSGQTCTAQNNSGIANANVTTVVVSCVATSTVDSSDLISSAVVEGEPVVAFVAGAPMALYKEGATYSSGEHISASRYLNGAWTAPVNLGAGSAAYGYAFIKLAASANGTAFALWANYGELFAARFDGTQWGAAVRLDTAEPALLSDHYRLAVDGSGRALVVWRSGSALVSLFASSYDAGTWSAPALVAADVEPLFTLSDLAMDGIGRATLAWADRVQGLAVSRHAWSTGFSAPALFGGANGTPAVAVDDAGNSIVVWPTQLLANFPLVSRRFDGSTWSAMVTVAGGGSPNAASNSRVAMASATQGGALAFLTFVTSDSAFQQVWSRRAFGAGAWEAPILLSDSSRHARPAGLATNASARAAAAFGPLTTDVYYLSEVRNARHGGASGTWTGTGGGQLVSGASDDLGIVQVAPPAVSDSGATVNVWVKCIVRTSGSPCTTSELRGRVTPP